MIEEPWESLENIVAKDARDWSLNRCDAWIYGIVCGWGDALDEVAERHGWSQDARRRLTRLHETKHNF